MNIITGIIHEAWYLLIKMAPYLLFGFMFSGIIHVFMNPETVARHAGQNNMKSVINASLFGVPLPLCSCGVIPASITLRKNGASKSATLSFLTSTPTTGIDSMMATYSLMGPFMAIYRVIAAFFAGIMTGILAILFKVGDDVIIPAKKEDCCHCEGACDHDHKADYFIKKVFKYAYYDLLGDTAEWIVLGILIGAAISFFTPDNFFASGIFSGPLSMLLMLVIGVPMYVCSTGSIPIAAALMYKGLDPGAAFVFLLAGPATNAVTITVVAKYMGMKSFFIYLASISFSALSMGYLLNILWDKVGPSVDTITMQGAMLPLWVEVLAAFSLVVGILHLSVIKIIKKGKENETHI